MKIEDNYSFEVSYSEKNNYYFVNTDPIIYFNFGFEKIKITQVKSSIRQKSKKVKTLEALGLRGIRKSVVKNNDKAIQGMLTVVSHLVTVEDAK